MGGSARRGTNKRQEDVALLRRALSEAALATHYDESTKAGRIIRLSDQLLGRLDECASQNLVVVKECVSILLENVSTRWRYLDNATGAALKRICAFVCRLVSNHADDVVLVCTVFLRKLSEYVTETVLVVSELHKALFTLLSRPLSDSWLVTTAAVVLSEVVSKGLGVTVTRSGAVVDRVHPGKHQGEVVRLFWLSSLKGVTTKPLAIRLCQILSETAERCTAADIKLGCTCLGILSMLLNKGLYKEMLPDLLDILCAQKLLFTVLKLTKMAYRVPSPLFLQGANDLLWSYCGADKEKHKDLYMMVFESDIHFEETTTESREAVVECLFWINAFNYPTCKSSDILHAMSWVEKYNFLAKLNKYLRRVRFDEDTNWFLLCANTYSNAFHPILYKLATSSPFPTSLRKSFQNDMQESGLLEITQSFIQGLVNLIKLKFRDGPEEMSEEEITDGYIIALATSNVVYFYALCMHDNQDVVQYCEVCGAFSLLVDTLEVSEWIFKASCDPDIVRLGARAQEEALGLLCTIVNQKLRRHRVDRWPLDDLYIRDGTYLRMIDLIGRLRPLQLVILSQRVVLIRKRMELLFYLTHYSKNVIMFCNEDMHHLVYQKTMSVLDQLKPQVDNLLQLKTTSYEGLGRGDAKNIEDIDSYHVLLGNVFNPPL